MESEQEPSSSHGHSCKEIMLKPVRSWTPGLRTDRSMDLPGNLKEADISELTMRPLADNPIKCSICKEVFTDPVCIPCGDSYCRMCITLYWKDPTQKGVYDCPQCSQTYSTRPELYVNGVVVQIIKRAKLSSARLGDLTCDFCTGQKLRAVKFCLTCSVAYCEVHIKQHYTVLYCRSTDLRRPQVELERYEN